MSSFYYCYYTVAYVSRDEFHHHHGHVLAAPGSFLLVTDAVRRLYSAHVTTGVLYYNLIRTNRALQYTQFCVHIYRVLYACALESDVRRNNARTVYIIRIYSESDVFSPARM